MDKQKQPLSDNERRFTATGNNGGWIKFPFGVQLQSDPSVAFKSILEYEQFVLKGEMNSTNSGYVDALNKYTNIMTSTEEQDIADIDGGKGVFKSSGQPRYNIFNESDYTDSRIGGNDAINPIWQFNRDDDIRPPMFIPKTTMISKFSTMSDDSYKDLNHALGMGRVYADTYDDNQQILWLEAGVPRFINIIEFYRDAADADVAEAINRGSILNFIKNAAIKVISTTVWAISLIPLSPFYLSRFIKFIASDRITKYYSFQPTMTMYYETVNSMMQYLAVAMGISPMIVKQSTTEVSSGDGASYVGNSIIRNLDVPESDQKRYKENGIPEVLRDGPDIFKIMNRRARLAGLGNTEVSTRELLQEIPVDGKGNAAYFESEKPGEYKNDHWWITDAVMNWFGSLKGSTLGAGNYVGFRIERGADTSESFSNSTGPSAIAEKLNHVSQEYKQERENYGATFLERIIAKGSEGFVDKKDFNGFFDQLKSEVTKTVSASIAKGTGFDIGTVLTTGNGFLDIPDVWKSSSFEKSFSFNIQLRSRYGDAVSVFQSIYIPLLMLLALSAPRAIGTNMYTSPFLVRGYCRGMFSVPLGIVTNISISRGRDDMGWTNTFLPTAVDVQFTIKDLSPTLFLSMADNGVFDTFTRNGNLLEYLDTLAALGLKERAFFFPKFMRKFRTALGVARTTIFSATYWGSRIGRSNVGRAINAFMVPFKNDLTSIR